MYFLYNMLYDGSKYQDIKKEERKFVYEKQDHRNR